MQKTELEESAVKLVEAGVGTSKNEDTHKEKEKENNLKNLRLGSKNINRDLELSIENGYSALIENMDERIDAILMPVIAR